MSPEEAKLLEDATRVGRTHASGYYKAQSVLGRSGINRMMRREAKRRGYELVGAGQ